MAEIATLEVLINVRQQNADALPALDDVLKRTSASADKAADAISGRLGAATRSAGADALRLAQAEARGLGIKGELGAASERLGSAIATYRAQMDGSVASAIKLANAENQLASVQNRIANSSASVSSSLSSLKDGFSGLATAAGGLGIAFGAQQIVQFGVSAAQASLELQKNENALRQIAGSQEVYNQILAAAKQQQIAFGGSLSDNLGELSTFAVAARTTGASLQDLIRTAQRLATLDPEQGIKGAKLALNEALSGNATSLNRRFEIPKAALDGLADSSTSAADKLAIVNKYLDSAGISANGLADSIPAATRSINEMSAALDTLKTSAGGGLAEAFTPAIQGVTQLTQALNGNATVFQGFAGAQQAASTTISATGQAFTPILGQLNAYNNAVIGLVGNLLGYNSAQNQANVAALQGAQSYAQYNAAVQQSGTGAAQLTEQQFAIAQAFVAQGQSAQLAIQSTQALSAAQLAYITQLQSEGVAIATAVTQAQGLSTTFNAIAVAQQTLADSGNASAGALANLGGMMQEAASGGAQAAATVNSLAVAFANGSVTAEQLYAALQAIISANQQAQATTDPYVQALGQASQASADASAATQQYQSDLQNEAAQSLINEANTQTLTAAKANLQAQAQAAANAIVASGGSIEAEASRLAASSSLIDQLTAAYLRLAAAQSAAGAGTGLGTNAQAGAMAAGRIPTEDQSRVFNQLVASKKAQEQYTLAVGSAADQQALLQHRVDQTTRYLGANSAEAIKARQALVQFQNAQAKVTASGAKGTKGKKAGGGGGAGGAKLSDQQKLNNTLATNEQRYQDQSEEAAIQHATKLQEIEQAHADKLLDIQTRYLEKRKQQADKNEIDKRENEVGFLERLTSSDLNKSTTGGQADLQRINADYYQRFDAAQKAAQSGDLQRSERLLDLSDKRASLELDYAEKIDAARQKKDKNEVARLQTLLGMRRQILDEEDKQAAQAGDAINTAQQSDIADEQKRYSEALAGETGRNTAALEKLTRALDNKADLVTTSAVLAGKNVAGGPPAPLGAPTAAPVAPTTTPIPVAPTDTPAATDTNSKLDTLASKFDALIAAIGNVANHDDISGVVGTLGSVGRDIKGAVSSMPRAYG